MNFRELVFVLEDCFLLLVADWLLVAGWVGHPLLPQKSSKRGPYRQTIDKIFYYIRMYFNHPVIFSAVFRPIIFVYLSVYILFL